MSDLASARRWLFGGMALTIAVYAWLAWGRLTVQDDARQFLLWMPRLTDPAVLNGDLMASYWQSVSPPLYQLPFRALAAIGVDPVAGAKWMAVPLLLFTTWAAWKLAEAVTGGRPLPALCAAAFAMAFVIHEDSVYTSSPRAFSHGLLFLFFWALVKDRWVALLVSLGLLAALYPAPALVAVTILGLSRIRVKPVGIDLSLRSVLVTGAAGVVVGLAVLPFLMESGGWGPTLTLEQARHLPNLMTPGGRSSIVDSAGNLGWHCSGRLGYLPALMPCDFGIPGATLVNLLLFVPYLMMAWRAWKAPAGDPNRIYLLALAGTAIWYGIAALVAFKLHLPGRYSQRVLEVLQFLALGQLLGGWIARRLDEMPDARGTKAGVWTITGFLGISFLTPVPDMKQPKDAAMIAAIRALPKDSMIAGVSEELNFVPVLTGRKALATPEHAIPYQLGYYNRINERLRASVDAINTSDGAVLRAITARYGVDYWMVERETLATGALPGRYPSLVGSATRSGTPALAARAAACARYAGPNVLLIDARCAAD